MATTIDDLTELTKDERIALILSPWEVEKHDDESGYITWEIWCYRPYWRICAVPEQDNQYAKACVERIVKDHNDALSGGE
jgi:hypothetical protein